MKISNISKKDESRKDRFVRIASRRTNEIIEKIRLLGNCSNKSSYEYSEQDINKIFSALEKEIKISKMRFTFSKSKRNFEL